MEKIQANMCFGVAFVYKNIRTCLFTHVLVYFLRLVLSFTSPPPPPHYVIMIKGLLKIHSTPYPGGLSRDCIKPPFNSGVVLKGNCLGYGMKNQIWAIFPYLYVNNVNLMCGFLY